MFPSFFQQVSSLQESLVNSDSLEEGWVCDRITGGGGQEYQDWWLHNILLKLQDFQTVQPACINVQRQKSREKGVQIIEFMNIPSAY